MWCCMAQAGCWDGSVALWRVAQQQPGAGAALGGDAACSMQLLLHFEALDGPVRALAWAPAGANGDACGPGDARRHLFAAVGHSDRLRVWDTR